MLPVYGHSAARCFVCGDVDFYDQMIPKEIDSKWNVRYRHEFCKESVS